MATSQSLKTIRLDVLAGPATDSVIVSSVKPHIIGRGGQSDVRLMDETVSRRHAQVWMAADTWLISDLESRHGTTLNGVPLAGNQASPIKDGDLVGIGPWTFIVRTSAKPPTTGFLTTTDDLVQSTQRVQKVPQAELSIRAQGRLDMITEAAATISASNSETELGEAVLKAVTGGTGVSRAAFLRHVGSGDEVELISYKGPGAGPKLGTDFSRSLIRAAGEGNVVRMDAGGAAPMNWGQSIVQLGIHSAICAPIMVNNTLAAFIYLDARNTEAGVQDDAAAFCSAIAKIAGMALGNLRASDIRARQKELETDIQAAHDAQMRLMPPPRGKMGRVTYAMRSIPGRLVAGDLFDAFPLADGRVALFLGDVAGKGVGAALLMATAQSHLNGSLRQFGDPGRALNEVNRYIAHHCVDGKFISLWVGVLSPRDDGSSVLSFVDAGHGYWLVRPNDGRVQRPTYRGGLPMGVDADTVYESESMVLSAGSRIVVYSDGVVEQTSPEGNDFGVDRAIFSLEPCPSPDVDVETLVRAVIDFAAPVNVSGSGSRAAVDRVVRLADDVTVASILIE